MASPDVEYLLLATTAAVLALLATPPVRALAVRLEAIDEPDPRRGHGRRVPRLGGLAVLAAGAGTLGVASLLGRPLPLGGSPAWLLAGVALVVATGVADDVHGLGPLVKLALETVAAGLALHGGYGFEGFTNPFTGGYVALGFAGGLGTVLWIVGVANAMNLIDGLDGLATGVGVIASAALLLIALAEGRPEAALLWAVLGGALAGFLVHNFPPASIFLGDTGSLLVGYLIAVLSIQSLEKGATAVVVLAPILALGLPIVDVALAVARRTVAAGLGGVLRGDREHIHDRLVRGGMTHRRAVLVLYGVCAALGALAFAAVVVQGPGNAVVVGAAVAVVWLGVRRLRASAGEG
jgi:UDP-GlcNAc:undecaprenyl-phosphate GlcNAc-1-phosphate transferase